MVAILLKVGDIIFFDWADSNDGKADHVGIVEKCEDGIVYTIEGNTRGDICKQNQYNICTWPRNIGAFFVFVFWELPLAASIPFFKNECHLFFSEKVVAFIF